MKKLTLLLITLVAMIILPISAYAASEPHISIPVSTIVRGQENSVHELSRTNVPSDFVGMTCDINATAKNQGSVHPNNDLIVSSNGSKVELKDVERESNGVTNAEGNLTLSDELIVSLKLGKDKVFSGGLDVNLHCEQPKEVEVCRDNKVITIKESERLDSDTDAPCPTTDIPVVTTTATELPNTGAGSAVAIATASGFLGSIGHYVVTKRRS